LDGDITIGNNTQIWDNVSIINKAVVGDNCIIQSGVRIGHGGFGYSENESHIKTMRRHYGSVIIGDDVFIGPNCVIYRGTIDNTIVGKRCKIGGLCHIGHNCILDDNIAMIAGAVLYGSVII